MTLNRSHTKRYNVNNDSVFLNSTPKSVKSTNTDKRKQVNALHFSKILLQEDLNLNEIECLIYWYRFYTNSNLILDHMYECVNKYQNLLDRELGLEIFLRKS